MRIRTKLVDSLKTALRTQPHSFVQRFIELDGLPSLLGALGSMDELTAHCGLHNAYIGCVKALMNNSVRTVLWFFIVLSSFVRCLIFISLYLFIYLFINSFLSFFFLLLILDGSGSRACPSVIHKNHRAKFVGWQSQSQNGRFRDPRSRLLGARRPPQGARGHAPLSGVCRRADTISGTVRPKNK